MLIESIKLGRNRFCTKTMRCAWAISTVKAEFENVAGEYILLDQFLKARAAQGLTQAQVAEKIGTTQSAVARMESGQGKHSPSLATLTRYANALECRLEVRLVRKPRPAGTARGRSGRVLAASAGI